MKKINTFYFNSESKQENRKDFLNTFKSSPIPDDELNTKQFPGETLAFDEVFGIKNYKIHRSPISSAQSYIQL